jgi:hypothetical protein
LLLKSQENIKNIKISFFIFYSFQEIKVYEGAFQNLFVELPEVKNDAFKRTLDFIEKRL